MIRHEAIAGMLSFLVSFNQVVTISSKNIFLLYFYNKPYSRAKNEI